MDHCLYQPSARARLLTRKKERSLLGKEEVSDERGGEEENEMKWVMDFAYQVPLFFRCVRVFLEVLQRHREKQVS